MCFDQGSLSLSLIHGLGFRSIVYILLNEVHCVLGSKICPERNGVYSVQ
jgi:hypothetical protein